MIFLLLIVVVVLGPGAASAGTGRIFKWFCEKNLIAEDPYPYAEEDFYWLMDAYFRSHKTVILDEILFRLRSGMLTPEQERFFWIKFKS